MIALFLLLLLLLFIHVIAVIVVFSYVHMQVCCVRDGDVDVFLHPCWRQSYTAEQISLM